MKISSDNLAKLRLIRSSGVGSIGFRRLLQRYATAQNALQNAHAWCKPAMRIATVSDVETELEALEKHQGNMIFWGDDDYPAALQALPDAPIVLSILGKREALHAPQVAMVGNRAASASGLQWTAQAAADFARAGVCVTSGLARGIDTAAHSGALEAGGLTVAVVAGGVNHIYPPENAALRARIIAHGAVVSEQPWGMVPTANLFPQRNRIIAGLSVGVVVAEATRHSGSLITAEAALGYGREVWAVPGSPAEARSAGPNWLLKQGAALIESAADVLAAMPRSPAPYVPRSKAAQPSLFTETQEPLAAALAGEMAGHVAEGGGMAIDDPRALLFGLLGKAPVTFDVLVRQANLAEAELSALLIELELEGHAVRDADGRWRRA